jgi:hypothetical protein
VGLLVTNNRDAADYLQNDVFLPTSPRTRQIFLDGTFTGGLGVQYIDKFDRCQGWTTSVENNGATAARWDPNLVDGTSASVGNHTSPINNQINTPWFVSAYDPSTTSQRLFQVLSSGPFQELNIADPEVVIDADPFPLFTRGGSDPAEFNFSASEEFAWSGVFNGGSNFVFLPEIDLAIGVDVRVYIAGASLKQNIIGFITISTAACVPSGIPGFYGAGADEFGRPQIFDESDDVVFKGVQFIADDESTANQPKGELIFWSRVSAPDTANDGRLYVKFVDFNPFGVVGVPNRIHLRETLFSRVNLTLNTLPTGSPPSPLNGLNEQAPGLQNPNVWYGSEGNRRINVMASDGTDGGFGHTNIVQASKGVVAAIITPPAPKQDPVTNREIIYQAEVQGDLGELVANATVDWTAARLSTVSEILATTPSAGETVTVDNVPIDRSIEFPPGFAVLEDGIPLTETTHYSVDEALGEITFVGPKPLGGGVEYTIRYAHTEAPATPSHGTVVDGQVFSNIVGVAQTRLSMPDNDALAGHLDQLSATTTTV